MSYIEKSLSTLKETDNYINNTKVLKNRLNGFNIIVNFKNNYYTSTNQANKNTFNIDISLVEEDCFNCKYQLNCYDDKIGPIILRELYSINKNNCQNPNDDTIILNAFYRVYRTISKPYD